MINYLILILEFLLVACIVRFVSCWFFPSIVSLSFSLWEPFLTFAFEISLSIIVHVLVSEKLGNWVMR
jgi:hypothetical protein